MSNGLEPTWLRRVMAQNVSEWWRGWESWEAAGDLQGRKPPGGPRWWLGRGQMGRGERTVALAGV